MVQRGEIVDVIFPSTCCGEGEISKIKNYLQSIDLTPRIISESQVTPRTNSNHSFPEFSAEARFEQLYEALKNPESTLIWCARGGYGSKDLLPLLAKAKPIKQNKIFIGFSDITSIAIFLQQNWGWKILCAPMLGQMIEGGKLAVDENSKQRLLSLIFSSDKKLEYGLEVLGKVSGSVKSEIIGGCLSVLAGHFGGDFQVDFADKILFLEDIDESGEKLDRYFSQIIEVILKTAKKPKAILLGEFCHGIKDQISKENINEAIKRFVARIAEFNLQIPVFKSKDHLGHSDKMRPLILGVETVIESNLLKQNF
ncbi:MAG: LD-carboxypeptidase [Rickettsiaceae bacterium]|jgi:muramoyltetrapeptide carboxypeptidase|nr:LD-carboxypeptidase [Rickettsiaceae bacterium]